MIFVYIAIAFVFIGLIAAVIGLLYVKKTRNEQKNAPIERAEVTVVGAFTEVKMMNSNFTSQTVDRANSYEQKVYSVQFRMKNNKKLTFKLNKKTWLKYHDGDQGILTYQGYKIIDFEPKKLIDITNDYFGHEQELGKTAWFYGEAQGLRINIPSSQPILCDMRELKSLISALEDDSSDWFFTIKVDDQIEIQFERDGQMNIKESNLSNQKTAIYPMSDLLKNIQKMMA